MIFFLIALVFLAYAFKDKIKSIVESFLHTGKNEIKAPKPNPDIRNSANVQPDIKSSLNILADNIKSNLNNVKNKVEETTKKVIDDKKDVKVNNVQEKQRLIKEYNRRIDMIKSVKSQLDTFPKFKEPKDLVEKLQNLINENEKTAKELEKFGLKWHDKFNVINASNFEEMKRETRKPIRRSPRLHLKYNFRKIHKKDLQYSYINSNLELKYQARDGTFKNIQLVPNGNKIMYEDNYIKVVGVRK